MPPVWDDEERAALVALLRAQPEGLSWPDIAERVGASGSAISVWADLFSSTLFGPENHEAELDHARRLIDGWAKEDFTFRTFLDADYPQRLREVRQIPPVLFTLGERREPDRAVSVVGSRNANTRSIQFAREVAERLVDRSLTVLSGLALGIDTAAHQAALDAGGRTVGVIGTGIKRSYPSENRKLQAHIADVGMVMSQFWPDSPPTKYSFPMRNAVMSAYGYATIVVAAGEHSGSRIQAREAVSHGRPVILSAEVASTTKWGASLMEQPGVYVAETPSQVMKHIDVILGVDYEIARLLEMASNET